MSVRWMGFVLLGASFLCGCELLDGLYAPIPPYVASDSDMSMGSPDATCTPRTMCPANTCGMVDDGCGGMIDCGVPSTCADLGNVCGEQSDGCGGTIDCGECACDGDVPTSPSCGVCGLGRSSCAQDVFSCEEPPWPDALRNMDCDALVFADVNASDGGDGSEQAPFNKLTQAVNAGRAVVLIRGAGTFAESVTVPAGVSIVGGYSREDGLYAPSFQPVLQAPASNDNVVGLRLSDSGEVLLSGFAVQTPDASQGKNNYGVMLKNANEVVLHRVRVEVGQAGAGTNGTHGENGADGEDGGDAHVLLEAFECQLYKAARWGGTSGGNIMCSESGGGAGGRGEYECFDQGGQGGRFAAAAGKDSKLDATVRGGRGGLFVIGGSLAARGGVDGDDAPAPLDAMHGRPGLASGVLNEQGQWAQGAGLSGDTGKNGAGGAGGGGASAYNENMDYPGLHPGSGGGGGGAGGCGGTPGTGGQSGGASLGLLLLNSKGVQLVDSVIQAGSGGSGGSGGVGGQGGKAGRGGRGDNRYAVYYERINPQTGHPERVESILQLPYSGGDGGDGARGQDGGHGGGGAGGASIGVYCEGSSVADVSGSTFKASAPAQGGASPGIPGPQGLSEETMGCGL